MRFFKTFLILLFSIQTQPYAAIYINTGHQKVLSGKNIIRVSVGDPKIADVQVMQNNQDIIITGMQIGSTSLMLWDKNHQQTTHIVHVGKNNPVNIQRLIQSIASIEGIQIKHDSGQMIIRGHLYKAEDLKNIENLKTYKHNIIDLSQFHPKALHFIAKMMQIKINRYGYQHVMVQKKGKYIHLVGDVKDEESKKKVFRMAKDLYPLVSNQLSIQISAQAMVFVDVKFLEIHSSSLNNIGVAWPQQIRANASVSFQNNILQSAGVLGQDLSMAINTLSENGKAKVLSNPKILCRNNTESSFLAGGEIPIRLISERAADIVFKPYGVSLKVKPIIDQSKRILLNINIKISDLDSSVSIEGIPGIIEHHIQTAADLSYGQTIALGGFYQNRSRKNIQRFPLLGRVPILGELFKSRSFQKKKTEFIVLLTPYQGRAHSIYQQNLLKRAKKINLSPKDFKLNLFD